MVRMTPDRVRRKLLLVVGRTISANIMLDGPPLAGWAPLRRTTGNRVWLKCWGRPGLRYTEPKAYRAAVDALTPTEAADLRLDFFYRKA